MATLFKNIKELIQVRNEPIAFVAGEDMRILPTLKNAYLVVKNGLIHDYGTMEDCPRDHFVEVIDATGQMILPSWCDSHTHIVYAGSREDEFVARIKGLTYEQIALEGGGILNSANRLQATSEDQLYEESKARLKEVMQLGTGAIEIKSGYGLTVEAELKMLRVIQRLKENHPIEVKATFLGAHAVPQMYADDKDAYVELLVKEFLPQVAAQQIADYMDVFCETGYFSVQDTERLLAAGLQHGLIPKIHVNQFTALGGVKAGVHHKALSVDHLEHMREEDIDVLKNTQTMPVALPGCSYFLSIPYTPARRMMDAGLPIALATDYNPGSSPSGNMNFVVATACIKMRMTPEEAINAATINGAYAMGLDQKVGTITRGKVANLILTRPIHSYGCIPYSFGAHQIAKIYLKGEEVV